MDQCGFSQSSWPRTASRTRRLIRLRATALPSARGTVKPMWGPSGCGSRTRKRQKRAAVRLPRHKLFGNLGIAAGGHFSENLRLRLPLGADRELLASARAAAGQHRPSVFRFHAGAESVGFGAVAIIRLKGAFRHGDSSIHYSSGIGSVGRRGWFSVRRANKRERMSVARSAARSSGWPRLPPAKVGAGIGHHRRAQFLNRGERIGGAMHKQRRRAQVRKEPAAQPLRLARRVQGIQESSNRTSARSCRSDASMAVWRPP